MMTLTKKVFAVLGIILLYISAVEVRAEPTQPPTLEPVTLQLKWLHQFQFAGYYAALEKGFYADEGLDVNIRPLGDDFDIVRQIVSGDADYAVDDIGILASYAEGKPIKALAAVFQHNALVFAAKRSSGIIGPHEMTGKRVMFTGTLQNNTPLKAMLTEAGLTEDDYTSVEHEFSAQALIDDRVDAQVVYSTSEPFLLQQQGIDINIINPQSYGFDFYGDILFTSEYELAQNPGRAERFRRASLKGWEYALTHPEELIKLIHTKYKSASSIENLRYEARETQKLILPEAIELGSIKVNRLRQVADIYAKLGVAHALSDRDLQHFVYAPSSLSLTAKEQDWLDAHPVIRVGVDRDFAPYEWVNSKGEYKGVAADYLRSIEQRLGIQFEIVADKPWHEIQAMAQRGELDILSCLNKTPMRSQFLDFSPVYVENPIVIITDNLQNYIGSLANLAGKTVAVERNYSTHENLAKNYPDIKLHIVESTKEALNLVATGEADAYVGDAAYASYSIKQAELFNLQFSGETNDSSAYRVGVNRTYPELLSMINKALNDIPLNERKDIRDRWMGFTVESGLSHETWSGVVAVVLLLFAIAMYRLVRLRRSRAELQKSETRLKLILDSMPVGCSINDTKGNILYVNQALIDLLGYSLEDIPTLKEWWPRAYPDIEMREKIIKQWEGSEVDGSEDGIPSERTIRCFNGEICHATIRTSTVKQATGVINISTFVDMTARKKAEEALQLSGRVFNEAREGIIITNEKGGIVDVNPAFTEITGYSHAEVMGKNPKILSSGKQSPEFYKEMWQKINDEGFWQGEIWNRKKNGELFAELLSVSALLGDSGEEVNYLGLFSDITESKQQQHTLEMMAHYDVLTHLPNRTLFADRFAQAVAHAERVNTLLAVCFLDLDDFKPVNDTHGHEVGDKLLIEVAGRIQANIRTEDTVSRQGGDEFALLLAGLDSLEQCQQMIDRIHRALEQPYLIDEQQIKISASSGITLFPLDNADADTLLRHADQAMYQAKLAGRNRYHIFNTEQDQKAIEKQNYQQEIENALANNEFHLYYQPKVNMKTGEAFGAEALIRWIHPQKGLVPPLDFLPAIENTPLEIKVGAWVINEALKQLASWREQGINLQVSVNISSNHLLSPTFFMQLDHSLAQYNNLGENNFQLEILESSALGDIDAISNIINTCQEELNISVALDDFGTGYSSLAHLRNLSASTIKIDQTFVRDLLDDPNDYAIIDGVIGLASSFDRNVIAEGVETDDHGLMLLIMGCEQAQGYGIARPMPAKDLTTWLAGYQPKQEWIKWANTPLSLPGKKLKLFRITAEHWFNNLDHMLHNQMSLDDDAFSIVLKNSCQNAWVSRARHEQLFGEKWLDELSEINTTMNASANTLVEQYQSGEIDAAQKEFIQLRKLFEQQQSVLDVADGW